MASNPSTPFLPTTRREFLNLSAKGIGLLAFSRFAPSFLVRSTLAGTPAPEKDKRILVIVQLAGGNDGLNTLIPFQDDNYYRLRPTIGIARDSVLRLNDSIGLHPSCDGLRRLVDSGTLALVRTPTAATSGRRRSGKPRVTAARSWAPDGSAATWTTPARALPRPRRRTRLRSM